MIGWDLLGLGHRLWPVAKTLKHVGPQYAIGCFDTTFGDALPNLKKLLMQRRYPAVRVHFWYSNNHTIVPMNLLKRRLPLYQKLAGKFPDVRFYLSHSCEHNEKNKKEVEKRINLIKKLAPSCIAVNSVWLGAGSPNAIKEVHGRKAKALGGIASNDGDDPRDFDMTAWMQRNEHADILFLWCKGFNFRPNNDEPVPAPMARKTPPTDADFKLIKLYLEEN